MLINQNGQTNVRDVRIKQYSHDADSITIAVDRSRAGHDLSALPLQLLIEASDVMDVVEEGVDDALFKVVNEDSIEITWRPQGRHTTGSERIMCQIVFADCGNVIAYTDTFAVIVEKSLKQVKDCIYADGYTMLDQYLKRLASIRNEAEEIKNATKEAAKQAQESAASAERSAGEASESAKAVAADKQEVEHLRNKVQTEAGDAENAQRGAEVAAGRAREFAGNAAGFASASEVSAQKAETSAAEAAESAQGAATIKQEVIKAGQDVIVEIAEAKETVLAVGRDAVKNIGISKDIAIKEVQDAATEITADREQIGKNKEDITELTAGLADLRKCKAGVIVDEVSGISSLIQDSAEAGFERLTLHGKSSQGSTTGAQLFDIGNEFVSQEKGGVTFTVENNEIVINGTATSSVDLFSKKVFWEKLTPGEYTFTIQNSPDVRLILNMDSKVYQTSEGAMTVKIMPESTISYFVIRISQNSTFKNYKLKIMLNSGPTALPWEPYTGGAPSPSPSYPQEIESAGMDGEIGIEVGNNGYIQKGTYFLEVRPFSLKKGYTYHIKCEKIIATTINCFVMNEYNKNLKNGAELYDYGYTTKKLTIPNSTGIVDKECMMPKRYDGDGYTFTVKAEGLYLYQAVNVPDKNTDELYIGYAPNILNEEYKKQTLIIPTPGGLPGIPVSSGGNYTDKDGQQWVADEIDLAMGERVQWIGKHELTGKENVADFGLSPRTRMVSIAIPDAYIDAGNHGYLKAVMSNKYKQAKCSELKDDINLIARGQQRNICFSIPTDVGIEDFKTDLSNQYASGRPVKVYYKLATPIRTPLPPETIAAYKSLKTYSPTTTVINDAGAGMSVGYKRRK